MSSNLVPKVRHCLWWCEARIVPNAASSFQKYLAPISCFCDHNVNTAVDLHIDFLYSQGADSSPGRTPGLDPEPYKPSGWSFCFSS